MGVSEALYMPTGLALVAEFHTSKTRSLAVGIHMTGIYMGQALGGFGATIADKFSWQTAFHTFGLMGILYATVLIFFLKDKKRATLEIETRSVQNSPKPEIRNPKSLFRGLGVLLSNKSFLDYSFLLRHTELARVGDKKLVADTFCQ